MATLARHRFYLPGTSIMKSIALRQISFMHVSQQLSLLKQLVVLTILLQASFGASSAFAQSCPAGIPSGSTCVPLRLSETQWYSAAGDGPYSQSGVIAAERAWWLANLDYCEAFPGSSTDIGTEPYRAEVYFGSILLIDYWKYSFNLSVPQPDCDQESQVIFHYFGLREMSCPEGFSPDPGSGGGQEICFRQPTQPDKEKNLGACSLPSNQGRPDQPGPCPKAGNPVNVATQNKFQAEIDYIGSGTFPLTFIRYYNSQTSLPYVNHPPTFDSLGLGWSATYFQSLRIETTPTAKYITAYRPDGRILRFAGSGSSYATDVDVVERMAPNGSGWKLTSADGSWEIYDSSGRLLSVRARHGETHSLQYSGGRVASVSDDFGHTLTFDYLSSGGSHRLSSVTDSAGGVISYDMSANLVEVGYPDTLARKYLYRDTDSVPHLLSGIVDETDSQYSFYEYDSTEDGNATSTSLAGGVEHYLIYGTGIGSASVSITEPSGAERGLMLDLVNGMSRIAETGAACAWCGSSGSFSYDSNGNVSSKTDPNGSITNYVYDLGRNLEASRTEAVGTAKARTTTTQWHATYRLPTLITEPKRKSAFTYDANGNILTRTMTDTSVTPNVARVWTYTYDALGRVLTEDGARTDVSDVTTYTYYSCTTGSQCGQLHTITDAAGHTTTYSTYNGHGQPLSIIDDNGVVTTLTYDARKRVTSRSMDGETTSYEYWPTGLLKKIELPDGSYLQYSYDAAHRLIETEDASGNRIAYTLDNAGNRTAEERYDGSGALSRTQARVFTDLNQLWQSISSAESGSQVTEYSYDAAGNESSRLDPLGRTTSKIYDELNRLKEVTDPAFGVTKYAYDALNNLTSITDPRNRVTTYTYSGFSNLTKIVSPDTGTTALTYDSGGNLQTRKDARNLTTTYSYDVLNRVTSVNFGDQLLAYAYDTGLNGSGRLVGVSDSAQAQSWGYDAQGRVTSATQTAGGISRSISYGYANAVLTSLTTPSGQLITYGYTNGKVTSLAVNAVSVATDIIREPFGAVRQWTWGNGALAARTLNHDGDLVQLDTGGDSYTYGYDNARRLTSIEDLSNPSLSWTYEYNDTDQLTSAQKSGASFGWTHDANGNRMVQSDSSSTTFTVASTSNRLTSTSGGLVRTYTYDAAGNTKTYSNRTLTFNNRGRLSSMKVGTATTTYVYNALGYRVKKAGSTVRLFAYDEQGHLIGEYDGAGALVQETVWLDDVPVATLRPKSGGGVDIFYVHTDHLNTPRKITRPTDSAVMWKWDSDAFGQALPNENPSGLGTFTYGLRFPGQYYDVESGLHYNHHRDYDPATGRYVESDPVGLKGGLNTYAYVSGAPQLRVDPSGLMVALADYEGDSNTNCCIDGVMTLCMDNPKNSDVKCGIVRDSMYVHERSHQAEFQTKAPTICSGVRGKRAIGYTTWEEFKLSELTAFNVQLDYLAKVRRNSCVSPECEEAIPQYMSWILNTAIPAVINGTYGR